ncbi:MAG: hypothetical protein IKL19_08320 [Paludibacteraceae bacterium]|nr:hypothetical protein [Paludibacteraceae bacterium]
MALALTEGLVSNERLRYSLNIHKYDITKMLKELCIDGYLVADGIGRGTTYHLNTERELNSFGDNLTSSGANLTSSGANLTSSRANLTSSIETPTDSNNAKNIKKKCTQQELFDMIIECTDNWKSIEEIAREVNRNSQYLKGTIIHKMVAEGLLQREFSIPNHPAQRYKRTQQGKKMV